VEENQRQPDHERLRQGLPGKQEQNREEQEPVEPTRRKPGEAGGGDPDSGGESGEGSQSTGNPDSAG
jgi:hypothetical protein